MKKGGRRRHICTMFMILRAETSNQSINQSPQEAMPQEGYVTSPNCLARDTYERQHGSTVNIISLCKSHT